MLKINFVSLFTFQCALANSLCNKIFEPSNKSSKFLYFISDSLVDESRVYNVNANPSLPFVGFTQTSPENLNKESYIYFEKDGKIHRNLVDLEKYGVSRGVFGNSYFFVKNEPNKKTVSEIEISSGKLKNTYEIVFDENSMIEESIDFITWKDPKQNVLKVFHYETQKETELNIPEDFLDIDIHNGKFIIINTASKSYIVDPKTLEFSSAKIQGTNQIDKIYNSETFLTKNNSEKLGNYVVLWHKGNKISPEIPVSEYFNFSAVSKDNSKFMLEQKIQDKQFLNTYSLPDFTLISSIETTFNYAPGGEYSITNTKDQQILIHLETFERLELPRKDGYTVQNVIGKIKGTNLYVMNLMRTGSTIELYDPKTKSFENLFTSQTYSYNFNAESNSITLSSYSNQVSVVKLIPNTSSINYHTQTLIQELFKSKPQIDVVLTLVNNLENFQELPMDQLVKLWSLLFKYAPHMINKTLPSSEFKDLKLSDLHLKNLKKFVLNFIKTINPNQHILYTPEIFKFLRYFKSLVEVELKEALPEITKYYIKQAHGKVNNYYGLPDYVQFKLLKESLKKILGYSFDTIQDVYTLFSFDKTEFDMVVFGNDTINNLPLNEFGFVLETLSHHRVSDTTSVDLSWKFQNKTSTAKVKFVKTPPDDILPKADSKPNFASMKKDGKMSGLIMISQNLEREFSLELAQEYILYYQNNGIKFKKINFSQPLEIIKFIKDILSKGEVDYLLREGHGEISDDILVSLFADSVIYKGTHTNDKLQENIYIVAPASKETTAADTLKISFQDIKESLRKRINEQDVFYFETKCNGHDSIEKLYQSFNTKGLIIIGTQELADTFTNTKDSEVYQLLQGVRNFKSYNEFRKSLEKNTKVSNYIFPDEEGYFKTPDFRSKFVGIDIIVERDYEALVE